MSISPIVILGFIAFGVIIYKRQILDFCGTIAAVLMGIIIVLFADAERLILMVIFLIVGVSATKYRYSYKKLIDVAESKHGRRNYVNVIANGIVPTAFAVLWHFTDDPFVGDLLKVGYIAAVASITADTLSSEIGVLSRSDPILITSLKRVEKGANGGVSLLGEGAGFLGAIIIGLSAYALGILDDFTLVILTAVIGGSIGFHSDSLMGATLEGRMFISNATVNFMSAVVGSLAGLIVAVAIVI